MSILVGSFNEESSAENAVRKLKSKGFNEQSISLIRKQNEDEATDSSFKDQNLADGTLVGAGSGGALALLAGIGALAVPGLGILAAGPIATAITGGAVTGGVIGGLVDYGIPEEKSRRLEEDINQGKTVVTVESSDSKIEEAANILRSAGALDVESH